MLAQLRIKNFRLIDELNIDFETGLNVITGETGAGKSMIINAINVILGGVGDSSLIKSDADFLEVEALFNLDLPTVKILKSETEINDILSDDWQLIIRRQIHCKKKNKCWINSHLVNLSLLQKIGNYLIDLHGQHNHQTLLKNENHIDFIDNLGDSLFLQKREQLEKYFAQWHAKNKEINQLLKNRDENLSKKDYLSFQLHEIDNANIKEGEDLELKEKINIIHHTVKIKEIMEMANLALYEGGEAGEPSLRDTLTKLISNFNSISNLDKKIAEIKEDLIEVQFKIEDITDQVIEYKESINFNAQLLQELEERLNVINQLKQKYGPEIGDIFKYREKLQKQLDSIIINQEKVESLTIEKKENEEKLKRLSIEVSKERNKLSKKVEKEIIGELKELNMRDCNFFIQISQLEDPNGISCNGHKYKITNKGIDRINFFISTNAGEEIKPLAEIVSGGEISRVMLGLKSILSKADKIPTMIFDEIDSGVGARLGEVIADKLLKISQNHQVIAVTHLPQIACKANQHLGVIKYIKNKKTGIMLKKLEGKEQLEEVAKMLDGEQYGSISLQHARRMLNGRGCPDGAKKG